MNGSSESPHKIRTAKRREKIVQLVKKGMRPEQAAAKLEVTPQLARIACRNAGGKFSRKTMSWTW
jgi:hypothetical protein